MLGRPIWMAGLAVLLAAGVGVGQEPEAERGKGLRGGARGPGMGKMPMVEAFISQLELSPEQQIEVHKIAQQHMARAQRHYQEGSGQDEMREHWQKMRQLREQIRDARQENNERKVGRLEQELKGLRKQSPTSKAREELLAKLERLLTPEQLDKYAQIKDELLSARPPVDLTRPAILRMALRSVELSEEQTGKVDALFEGYQQVRRQARGENRRQKLDAEGKKIYQEVLKILTPKQQTQLKKWRMADGRRMMLRSPLMLRRALRRVELNEEQQTKVDGLFDQMQQEGRGMERGDREARRKLGQKFYDEVMKVLTPEQKQQLERSGPGPGDPRGPGRGRGGPRGPRGPRVAPPVEGGT